MLDVCVASPPAPGIACCPGTAGDTYCAAQLKVGATCDTSLVCTACGAITANTYIVDPTNGSDTAGNGSAVNNGTPPVAAEGCALKTITRALQIIGPNPVNATTIEIVGTGGGAVGAGETFPLVIPANVTVTTKSGTGAVTVTVAAGKNGFTLGSPTSAIQGNAGATLTITTEAGAGTVGILVNGAAVSASTTISDVTISKMGQHGIEVTAGSVAINAGVVSNTNGTAAFGGDGLFVTGGQAVINVAAGAAATTFNANTAHGILVEGNGRITLTGSVTNNATGAGTVETNGNAAAGVWLEQTAPLVGTAPLNTITGLISFGNTGGNGMRIVAGSQVTVRKSVFLNNSGDGVIISAGGPGSTNSMVGIDLGDVGGAAATIGDNTFQSLGATANKAAGLCIDVTNQTTVLPAVGNQFSLKNCIVGTTGAIQTNPKNCQNLAADCVGGVCDLGFINPASPTANSTNAANVSTCTE